MPAGDRATQLRRSLVIGDHLPTRPDRSARGNLAAQPPKGAGRQAALQPEGRRPFLSAKQGSSPTSARTEL
eukprot:COSAG01_NODE_12357_length_1753_cov_2.945586_2_plen_71_part_00